MTAPSARRRPWWLRVAETLLVAEALVLAVVGFYWYATAPETETLGRGTAGVLLIVCAAALALLGLLGFRHPGIAGTVLLVIGVPVLVAFLQEYLGDSSTGFTDEELAQIEQFEREQGVQEDPSTMFVLAYGAAIAIPVGSGLLFALGSLARSSARGSGEASSTPASSAGS